MGKGVEHRHIGPWLQLQMMTGRDVRRTHQVYRTGVYDHQLGPLAQALFHSRPEHRVRVGGIGTDDHDDV